MESFLKGRGHKDLLLSVTLSRHPCGTWLFWLDGKKKKTLPNRITRPDIQITQLAVAIGVHICAQSCEGVHRFTTFLAPYSDRG